MKAMQVQQRSSGAALRSRSAGAAPAARVVAARRSGVCRAANGEAGPEAKSATTSHENLWPLMASAPATWLLLSAPAALAKDGEYGLLEGRTAALVHPAFEFFLLGATLYAGYLGLQWRKTRELGEEIRKLRASAPVTAEGTAAPSPEIEAKEQERKALLAGNFKDKHFVWGSLLLASGVGIAIEGCANTFIRTGRLFPGPHLYAGAFIVALWALAAALVPAMQKGDNNARNAHIALNTVQVLLLLSQVPTGLEIVGKVFEFTSWP